MSVCVCVCVSVQILLAKQKDTHKTKRDSIALFNPLLTDNVCVSCVAQVPTTWIPLVKLTNLFLSKNSKTKIEISDSPTTKPPLLERNTSFGPRAGRQ